MQYTRTFREALALSCDQGCPLWSDTDGTIFDIDALAEFAEEADVSHPLGNGLLCAVSAEGAIGICGGREYDIDWVFYPVEDEGIRAKYVARYQRELAESRDGDSGGGTKYCMYCGAKIPGESNFCPQCGRNVNGG